MCCFTVGVAQVECVKKNNGLHVGSNNSYKEGRDIVCHDAFPLAFGCAIKRTNQLIRELIDEVQDGVISWTMIFLDAYGTLGCPMCLNCNAPMLNIDEDKW